MPLRSRIEFGAFAQYAVRANSALGEKSRRVRDAVKRGDTQVFDRAAIRIANDPECAALRALFGDEVVLVPAPGSAPLRQGALWVPELICAALLRAGLARTCYPWLTRTHAVKKSAFTAPAERPDARAHYDSMQASASLDTPARMVVVDDVVTRGCTLLGAVSRLNAAYPNADIKAFALMRAISNGDIDDILSPRIGRIDLQADGSTWREP